MQSRIVAMDPEHQLLSAWQDGDLQAGDTLIRRHFVSIHRFFASKVPEQADDLAQRTFLSCTEVRQRVDPTLGLRGYLFGIARRVLLAHLREAYRHPQPWSALEHSVAEVTKQGPSGAVAAHEQQAVVLEAMQRLPLDFQICLELYYWEDLSIREIAAVLEVAPGTVKSRLGRGRKMLEELLRRMKARGVFHESTLRDLAGWAPLERNGEPSPAPALANRAQSVPKK